MTALYELTIKDGRFYNRLTRMSPLFLHLNGSVDPAAFLKMMEDWKEMKERASV